MLRVAAQNVQKSASLRATRSVETPSKFRMANEDELKAYFVSFGYSLEITKSFRRIFIKELNASGDANASERCQYQLYCGHIPSDVTERELFDLLQPHGNFHEICLMMDATTQRHRGFAFIKCDSEASQKVVIERLNDYEIRPEKRLKLTTYQPNRCLYIGNIPKSKDQQQLTDEFTKMFDGIAEVIVYRPLSNCRLFDQNRGFCFLKFDTHEQARLAKRAIERELIKLFGCTIFVDWADSINAPNDSIMQGVRVLYVRNVHEIVTETELKHLFGAYGEIERVKKIKNFAFVHFVERAHALHAMKSLQNLELCGERLTILLSYPPLDKKKKEEMLRIRQERISLKENPIRIRY